MSGVFGVLLSIPSLGDDLKLVACELIRAAKLNSESLNDHLFGKGKFWVGAQLQKGILRELGKSNAAEDSLLLLLRQLALCRSLADSQVALFLLDVKDVLDLVRDILGEVELSVLLHGLKLDGILLVELLLEGDFAVLLFLFGKKGPQFRLDRLLGGLGLFGSNLLSDRDVLADNLDQGLLSK